MSQEMAEFFLQVSDVRSVNYVITASIGQSRAWFWYTLNEISAALFTYDTLLTLSREVEHIWKPRPFFSDTIYTASPLGHDFIFGTGEHIYHGFLMARAYAISNKNVLLIVILLPLVFASTGLQVESALALGAIQNAIVVRQNSLWALRYGFVVTVSVTAAVTTKLSLRDVITVGICKPGESQYKDSRLLERSYLEWSEYMVCALVCALWRATDLVNLKLYILSHDMNRSEICNHKTSYDIILMCRTCKRTPAMSLYISSHKNALSLSATILCRFQLDLRERHVRRDDCTLDQVTLGTFKAATRRVHEAVVDEFGDTELFNSLEMRQR
ncbi:hypothetical protein BU17DRAFT_63225 [Hysterangium stoloniferum]|nr:hypothetical protein BU17DRAFT_63225 [Hysterangium stoloniferum]